MSQNDHRSYSEKRDFIRMQVEAQVVLHHGGREYPALCRDLSSTGMQLEADARLSIGDKVRVHIPSDHAELKGLDAEAEVVRISAGDDGRMSIGLAITSMS
ncbi:PilZ domain-containing protein [Metapseudomonas otitidis]|uniref:PilZ domain-containing protein n=1 Tax=Metapseudomonas otitidis TaxID=319939 RepID=UPI000D19A661|nr:PilZ domain-containing protein [Pseudomonas otitidis]